MKLSESQLRNIVRDIVKEERGSCWKGYEQVGMKDKDGRKVPNCVPVKEQEDEDETLSEGMQYHLRHGVGVDRNIYRPGSEKFFELFQETRRLIKVGKYSPSAAELELLQTDIGKWGIYEGKKVPLDWPMLYEAEYKGRKVELNKPKRGEGGRAYVYVRNPKTGKVIKVSFGSSMPDAMGDSEKARKRRKSFGDRHNCADKKDKTKAGYWSCRATKFFGRNIPGWW